MNFNNKIYTTDCIQYMRTCPAEMFDLVIADPPYFMIYGEFDFGWSNLEEYLNWCKTWILEVHRVLKTNGSFYLWGKIGYGKGYALFHLAEWIEKESLFQVRNWITQRNSRGRGNKQGFMEAREELLFLTKSKHYTWHTAYTKDRSTRTDLGFDGKPRKNSFKRCSDVWIDIAEASQSSKERFYLPDGSTFPTVKPLKACCRIVEASSNVGDLVYIPFGGTGSEAVACELLNRDWRLTEIENKYIDFILRPRLTEIIDARAAK